MRKVDSEELYFHSAGKKAGIPKIYPIPKDHPEQGFFKSVVDCQKSGVKVESSFENDQIREAMHNKGCGLSTDFIQE